jgi:hypothetical protein
MLPIYFYIIDAHMVNAFFTAISEPNSDIIKQTKNIKQNPQASLNKNKCNHANTTHNSILDAGIPAEH